MTQISPQKMSEPQTLHSLPNDTRIEVLSFLPLNELTNLCLISKDFSTNTSRSIAFLFNLTQIYAKVHSLKIENRPCETATQQEEVLKELVKQVVKMRKIEEEKRKLQLLVEQEKMAVEREMREYMEMERRMREEMERERRMREEMERMYRSQNK